MVSDNLIGILNDGSSIDKWISGHTDFLAHIILLLVFMFLSFTALYELASIDGCYDKNVRKFMSTQKAIDCADHAAKWKTFFEAVRPEVAFQLFGGVSLNSEKVAIFAVTQSISILISLSGQRV